jgi:uncharacterized membrane protein YvlD (DUF360 family)
MRPFVLRWLGISFVIGLVLWTMGTSSASRATLIGAALFLGLINALVRPLTLRLTHVGLVIATVAAVVGVNVLFFTVLASSIPAYRFPNTNTALLAAGIVSLVSWPLNFFFRSSDGHLHAVTHHETPAAVAPAESQTE